MVFKHVLYDFKLIGNDTFFDLAHISLKLRLNEARKVVIKLLKLERMNTDEKKLYRVDTKFDFIKM
jgi:hypothetical protein